MGQKYPRSGSWIMTMVILATFLKENLKLKFGEKEAGALKENAKDFMTIDYLR